MKRNRKMLLFVVLISFTAINLFGCAGSGRRNILLPSESNTTLSKKIQKELNSFKNAMMFYDGIKEAKTTINDANFKKFVKYMKRYGGLKTGNRFLHPSVMLSELPEGIQQCIINRSKCFGLELNLKDVDKYGVGSFFMHTLGFNKKTQTTGWWFSAFFVVVDDIIVYKEWSGESNVYEIKERKNPFGLLQEFGKIIKPPNIKMP